MHAEAYRHYTVYNAQRPSYSVDADVNNALIVCR